MSILKELWLPFIQEGLYANNEFLKNSQDDSAYVDNQTVRVPNAGANSGIVKNPSFGSLPLAPVQRTDVTVDYTVDQYAFKPIALQEGIETIQLSYDKMRSVIYNSQLYIGQAVGSNSLYSWAPTANAAQTVLTTGSSVSTALAPGATGTRKAITGNDILQAKKVLDAQNIPQEGRVMVIDASLNYQMLLDTSIQPAYSYGSAVIPNGKVARIWGFDVYVRSATPVYAPGSPITAPTKKAIEGDGTTTSTATTDCLSAICYHPAFVSRAVGAIEMSYQAYSTSAAAWYANIFSAYVMFGAAPRRTNNIGVVSIVQTA